MAGRYPKKKRAAPSATATDEPEGRVLPLNTMIKNRDRAREKAQRLMDEGKMDEAREQLQRADHWQDEIDGR